MVTSTVASGLDKPFFTVDKVISEDILIELENLAEKEEPNTPFESAERTARACRNKMIPIPKKLFDEIYSYFEDNYIAKRITEAYRNKCVANPEWFESQLKYAAQFYTLSEEDIKQFQAFKDLSNVEVVLPKMGYKTINDTLWACELNKIESLPCDNQLEAHVAHPSLEKNMAELYCYSGNGENDGCDEHRDVVKYRVDRKSIPVAISVAIVKGKSGVTITFIINIMRDSRWEKMTGFPSR